MKTKGILKPKYKLSGGRAFVFSLPGGGAIRPSSSISYATAYVQARDKMLQKAFQTFWYSHFYSSSWPKYLEFYCNFWAIKAFPLKAYCNKLVVFLFKFSSTNVVLQKFAVLATKVSRTGITAWLLVRARRKNEVAESFFGVLLAAAWYAFHIYCK